MARRRKESVAISLFPFLSILACVIGTLTLLITAMALGQMDNEVVHSAERFEKVKRLIEEEERRLRQLREKLEEAEAGANEEQRKLAEARMRLEELKRQREALFEEAEMFEEKPEIDIPIVDEERHEKRMAAIREELEQLDEEIARLQAEVAERGGAEASKVVIQPSGSGTDLDPTFVECTASGLVLLEEDPPRRIRRSDMATDESFLGLLDAVAEKPKRIVIFLVREDALDTYFAAYNLARRNYARAGKLPVVGQGKIDLSVFEQLENQ